MENTFYVRIRCNVCGDEWEEMAFLNENVETELMDDEGGWVCPTCDTDEDTEIVSQVEYPCGQGR